MQRTRIFRTLGKNRTNLGNSHNFKTYNKAIVIHTVWSWCEDGKLDQ